MLQNIGRRLFTTVTQGAKYSPDFRAYLKLSNGQIGSYFHDIPLNLNLEKKTVNVVIEIPRWSNAKFEINKQLPFNPITQDIKKNKPRFVKNLFPFKGYIQNYGAIPQTWDDPTLIDEPTGYRGDNDPIDVCEIGSRVAKLGDVFEAKILGSLALIDDGELDWKVIVIDTRDELAQQLNDIRDVERKCPNLLESTRRWFKDYKIPDGKSENEFGFEGRYLSTNETVEVIKHSNDSWKKLVRGSLEGDGIPLITNATVGGSPGFTEQNTIEIAENLSVKDAPLPDDVDKVYYV